MSTRPAAVVLAIAGALLVAASLFPIYWMIAASLMPESRLFESHQLIPAAVTLEHYRALFDERDFLVPIRNSLLVSGLTTIVAVPVAALCAYSLAGCQCVARACCSQVFSPSPCFRRSRSCRRCS